MSFLDHLLGATGCNVDGSISQNPLTNFIDYSMTTYGMEGDESQIQQFHMQSHDAGQVFHHQSHPMEVSLIVFIL
jgi:hypothetical protein